MHWSAVLGLIGHAPHFLLAFHNGLETFPAEFIEQAIFMGVDGTGDWIISGDGIKRFGGYLPLLPLNHYVPMGSIVMMVFLSEWAFVAGNMPELPKLLIQVILLAIKTVNLTSMPWV